MRGASRTHQAGLRLGLGSFTGREPGSAITRLRRSIVNRIIANPVRGKTPIWGEEPSRLWPRYIKALGLISAVSLVSFAAAPPLTPTNLAMLYLLVVVIVALRWGRGPAVCSALAGAVAFNFFLIPERMRFSVSDIGT